MLVMNAIRKRDTTNLLLSETTSTVSGELAASVEGFFDLSLQILHILNRLNVTRETIATPPLFL
jgi:hypothetical protein